MKTTAAERRALQLIKIASEVPADPRRRSGAAWPRRDMIERLIDAGLALDEYVLQPGWTRHILVVRPTTAGLAVLAQTQKG